MLMPFDWSFVLLIPALIFAFWAQFKVQSTFQKYLKVRSASGLTGRQIAATIMARHGITDVQVEETSGVLSDHYDPRTKKVRLSKPVYEGDSIASIAVGAHEIGHVLQHAQGYVPLQVRSLLAPVAGFGSMLAFPLFFIGLIFGGANARWLMDLGILFFSAAVFFQIVTLPVEFNASSRALANLTESGALMPEEVSHAKKVLDAAALTYLAAAAMAALQLMRLILIRNNRN